MEDYRFGKYMEVDEQLGRIFVQRPDVDMQKDEACFEAAALYLKAKNPNLKIAVGVKPFAWEGTLGSLTSAQGHYMRFLYRLSRFTERMEWCHADEAAQKELARFETALQSVKPTCNVPEQPAQGTAVREEARLERLLLREKRDYFERLLADVGIRLSCLDQQLPNGLFDRTIGNEHRIFPTGFLDIWGITDRNELCIFELKTNDNTKMGLLSELFFYAEFAKEFLLNSNCLPNVNKSYRSYGELLRAVNSGCKNVRAFFLTGTKIHPNLGEYQDQILALLNSGTDSIQYGFLEYNPNQLV